MVQEKNELIKVAVFDAKSYDRSSFGDALKEMKKDETFEFVYIEPRLSPSTAYFAAGCDAVCCFVNDDLSEQVLIELYELQISLVLMRCAGFDKVDLRTCRDLDIHVARVPAYSPYAVAEFAISLLLTLNRKLHRAFNRVRDGNFTLSGLVGFDVHGKTVGVIGTGKIGQCFIDIVLGFGCKVLCYDLYPSEFVRNKPNTEYVEMDDLLSNSDIISIHVPLTRESHHLINKNTINKMKAGVIIINTSRGALVDAEALVESLVSGHVGGAGLDVYENEGDYFFRDCSDTELSDETLARLSNMRNVLITSHQAFLTEEALRAIAATTVLNLDEFYVSGLRSSNLTNYVAPPVPTSAVAKAHRTEAVGTRPVGVYARRKKAAAATPVQN